MWRYLKSAFLVGVDIPGLGRLPVNALAAAGFAILGFGQPAFWFAGAAVEVTFVTSLAFSPRFQKYVESQQLKIESDGDEEKRYALIAILPPASKRRIAALGEKCARIVDVYRAQQAEDFVVDANRDALSRLQWTYLKLLVAQHHIEAAESTENAESLGAKILGLECELKDASLADSLRESKTATVAILKKRLENIKRKGQTQAEIASDCIRIEAQVDLLLDNASIQGKPQTISSDIELASDLIGAGVFGDDEQAITHLDRKYTPAAVRQDAGQ